MNTLTTIRTAAGVARAATRWERPDRLTSNLIVSGLVGPTLAGAVAGATARGPERVAIDDGRRQLTYAHLWRSAQAVARMLRDDGVTDRSVIGLLASNSAEFVIGLIAASILGADTVFLNTGFAAPQLADVCAREGVSNLVCDQRQGAAIEAIGIPVSVIEVSETGPSTDRSLLDRLGRAARFGASGPALSIIPSRRQARQVILTSGTTGRPKGANRSGVSASGLGIFSVVPIRSGDRVVIACPLFHAWGLSNLLIALTLGSSVRLPAEVTPDAVLAALDRGAVDQHPADGLVVVPAVLQRLVSDDFNGDLADRQRPGLRYIVSSGARLAVPLVDRTLGRFGPVLYNFYGSTEVSLATIATPADLERFPDTAGRVVPGTELSILNDDGEPVAPGDTGRVFVDSNNAFDGYTGGGDKPRHGRLIDTGDLGHVVDGMLFVDGRSDDMIVSGGENVFPGEVEDLILRLDAVIDAAVIGVDDDQFGQRLVAVVVAGDDRLTESDVQAAVRGSLARFKVPRQVYFVDELPRTESGKVRRPDLLARYGGRGEA